MLYLYLLKKKKTYCLFYFIDPNINDKLGTDRKLLLLNRLRKSSNNSCNKQTKGNMRAFFFYIYCHLVGDLFNFYFLSTDNNSSFPSSFLYLLFNQTKKKKAFFSLAWIAILLSFNIFFIIIISFFVPFKSSLYDNLFMLSLPGFLKAQ